MAKWIRGQEESEQSMAEFGPNKGQPMSSSEVPREAVDTFGLSSPSQVRYYMRHDRTEESVRYILIFKTHFVTNVKNMSNLQV